jgi:arginyl-tRNA synthetase
MYTHSRIQSLLEKAQKEMPEVFKRNTAVNSVVADGVAQDVFVYESVERKALLNTLYLPCIISSAVKANAPNLLIEFLLTCAHDYNAMYAEGKIISEDFMQTKKKVMIPLC